uniref:Putative transcriptional regulatory protein n=1 Tax=Talaromyces marneffei PM1 TaxID=1077442 RepID=A0A093Y2Y4_TALMA
MCASDALRIAFLVYMLWPGQLQAKKVILKVILEITLESRMSAMQRQLDLMSNELRILRRRSQPPQRQVQRTTTANKPTDSRWASRAPISPSYVGPTSSEFGLNVPNDDVPDMDETENSEIAQPSSPTSPYAPTVPPEDQRRRTNISRNNPLLSLDAADALRLVDVYEEAIGLMYPVVDLKSIREYIVDYYSQHSHDAAGHMSPPQSGNEDWWFSARDTEVLKLVLALALISESPGQSELGNILASSAENTFATTRTQVPEVDMKELILLTLVSLYHSCRDDDILAWRTIGLASRGAMQMGLHRCDTWLRTGGIFPGDLERSWAINLFWCIYVFDKEFSFETGLPFSMRDSDMDSNLPRPNLLSVQSIRNNFAGANIAVANAKNTIQALSNPSYVSAIYSQRPQPFDRFLFSALATLFLAMFHYPDYFVNICRDSFAEALNALKRSSTRGRHSRRLRKVMKNLKRLGTNRPSTRSNILPTADDVSQAAAVKPRTASNAQSADIDHSVYSFPPSLVNETTPDAYSDLTNFFEFAGDFFMDPQPGFRGEVDQTNAMLNEQLHNSLDMFQAEDEALTRLMMGLL